MKKLISVVLAGALALSLAACGSTPASTPASTSGSAGMDLRALLDAPLTVPRRQAARHRPFRPSRLHCVSQYSPTD